MNVTGLIDDMLYVIFTYGILQDLIRDMSPIMDYNVLCIAFIPGILLNSVMDIIILLLKGL